MPPNPGSRDPTEWYLKGQQDLDRVPRRLQEHDSADAAFRLQQALEKYLKGFLIARGWRLQRTHNLSVLLDEAVAHRPDLERYRAFCQEASAFYVEERYPIAAASPDGSELETFLLQARQLVALLVPPGF